MWGGDASRNMVNMTTGVSLDFKPAETPDKGKNLLWTAPLGSQTYGNPVIAGGRVFVGTNNGGEYREQHKGDRGIVLCFDEKSGELLWQLTREKLASGRVNDWPEQGICSTPCVEDGRAWVITNRCEVMCVDVEGFRDGENDGPFTDEVDTEELDADIIWSYDMMDQLGVFPHNLATSSPVIHGDLVLLLTSNGVAEEHLDVPSPRAPSFIALNKNTGELVWEDASPSLDSKAPELFANILHGQWSSPALVTVDGVTQVLMPGGDGVLYSYKAEDGELIWWFDLNPKDSGWELGGRGTRNNIISTPVVMDSSVILAVGQDPEHGEGVGHIYRIDATKKGDVSPTIADDAGGWKENPNSGQIWHWGGVDEDGSITGEENGLKFRRTMSTVAIVDGLVYAADLSGFLHCLDYETGERYWQFDAFAAVWGSPMYVDGYVMLGDEDGEVAILKAGKELEEVKTVSFRSSIYSTPSIANGVMYVTDRSRLYAIKLK
jgi:outer membrane protein assembly factor BamB